MKTFSSMQGNASYKPFFCIEFSPGTPVSAVSLSHSNLTLDVGKTHTFYPTFTPGTATSHAVSYTSSNPAVATVDSNGKVTAKAVGTTIITVKSKYYSSAAPATCKITVKLPDGDNDGIPDEHDEDLNSIAILTIFSTPPGGGNSSFTPEADIKTGHSFLTLKNITNKDLSFNCITIPPGEELSFGTWDNKHKGIYYNFEAKELNFQPYKYKGRVSMSVPIGLERYEQILSYVTKHDTWSLLTNCSSFASGLWNEVVSEYKLSAGAVNSPYELSNSIKGYENEKLYGYQNIYEFERDIKFSKEFTLEYLGYIESGKFENSSE